MSEETTPEVVVPVETEAAPTEVPAEAVVTETAPVEEAAPVETPAE